MDSYDDITHERVIKVYMQNFILNWHLKIISSFKKILINIKNTNFILKKRNWGIFIKVILNLQMFP
jgi:hypothetical protein